MKLILKILLDDALIFRIIRWIEFKMDFAAQHSVAGEFNWKYGITEYGYVTAGFDIWYRMKNSIAVCFAARV